MLIFRWSDILYLQLYLPTLVGVLLNRIDNIERVFRLDITTLGPLPEAETFHDDTRLGVDEFQFDMLLMTPHHLRGTEVIDITGQEQRLGILRTMRCQAPQLVMQFLGDILEVYLLVDVEGRQSLLWQDMSADILLEAAAELRDILLFECQADGIGMSSEILQDVTTDLDGGIEDTAGNAAC